MGRVHRRVAQVERRGEQQARMVVRLPIWQRQHPAGHRRRLSTQPELLDGLLHEIRRRGVVRGLESMGNGLGPLSLGLIKAGGPVVQDWYYFRVGGMQSREQGFAKELMQPVAAPLLVQGPQEEIGSVQKGKHLLTD